jgi:hypothetical protein
VSARGEWDPDGSGIRKIQDEQLAQRIWEKAKKIHAFQAIVPTIFTALFYFSPI